MLKDAETMHLIDFVGIAILVFGVVGFMLYVGSAAYDDQHDSHHRQQAKKRMAMGGQWYRDENLGCQKEYQSCGPDENRPGYTICEQKFKRVYPEGGV